MTSWRIGCSLPPSSSFPLVGFYCSDTNRVMEFTKAEIESAVASMLPSVGFGEGVDRKTMIPRRPDSKQRPWVHVGGGMNHSDEITCLRMVEKMASIPIADSLAAPSLPTVDGVPARVGSPQEILAAIRAMSVAREGLRRAGRPGMPIINCVSSAIASSSMFAASHPAFGARLTDGYLIDFVSEMVVNYASLQRAAFYASLGAAVATVGAPMYGGYAGGAENVAILCTAYIIGGWMIFRARYHFNMALHQRLLVSTAHPIIWANSLANQAATRNMNMSIFNTSYLAGEAGSRMSHLEDAAYLTSVVASGAQVYTGHPARAAKMDSLLPDDHQLQAEIGIAAASFSRERANEVVSRLYSEYSDRLEQGESGWIFGEVYDRTTGRMVNPDYEATLQDARRELRELGYALA